MLGRASFLPPCRDLSGNQLLKHQDPCRMRKTPNEELLPDSVSGGLKSGTARLTTFLQLRLSLVQIKNRLHQSQKANWAKAQGAKSLVQVSGCRDIAGLMQNHHERLTLPVAEPRGIKISRNFWIPDKVPFSNWGRRPTADIRSPGFPRRKLAISPLQQIPRIPKVVFHKS